MNRQRRSSFQWSVILIFAIVVVGALGYGIYLFSRPMVTITAVVEGPLVQAFYSTGTIQPEREYPIKSSTAGTLTRVLVDKGDHVALDQPLAIITDPAELFMLDKAKAEEEENIRRADESTSPVLGEYDARLKGTEELVEIAQRDVGRISQLMQSNAGAQNDLDRSMDRVKQLMIEVESIKSQRAAKKLELDREVEVARAATNIAKWNVEQQSLKSPVDGVVLDRPTSLGTRVAVNDPIMRVANVAPVSLVMRADVDEEDVAKVNVGQVVRMTLYSFAGQAFNGKVTRIYDQADSARRTFEVDIHFDHPNERFSPGMTGELAFVMAEKESTLVIPSQGLQDGTVYVVRNNKVGKAPVQAGLKSIERVEILSGLSVGDDVIISPATSLSDGGSVRTTRMDPAAAAGLNKPPPITGNFKGF